MKGFSYKQSLSHVKLNARAGTAIPR